MIGKDRITEVLKGYKGAAVATICSHTALQIFYGAKQEGLKTIGICKPNTKATYEAFPFARPDVMIEVDDYSDVLEDCVQEKLRENNAIIVPHGSFVEYVGASNIKDRLLVPMYGNREVLDWESDRKKEARWLAEAGIRMPEVFKRPSDIDRLVMVKFPGAKGGMDYFLARSEEEFFEGLAKSGRENEEYLIQEYIVGTRLYPHFFHSSLSGKTEFLSVDVRYESNIDGLARVPEARGRVDPTFVVTGNIPVVVRESLLPRILEMGSSVVESSKRLFPPGIYGPFCVETTCTDRLEFVAFEISARIVAGTNLFVQGSPYSQMLYGEEMSTGRRIAREIKTALGKDMLPSILD